jgi:hypothetical protein
MAAAAAASGGKVVVSSVCGQTPSSKQGSDSCSSDQQLQRVLQEVTEGAVAVVSLVSSNSSGSSNSTGAVSSSNSTTKASGSSCALEALQASPWCGSGDATGYTPQHLVAARSSYDDLISRLPDDLLL